MVDGSAELEFFEKASIYLDIPVHPTIRKKNLKKMKERCGLVMLVDLIWAAGWFTIIFVILVTISTYLQHLIHEKKYIFNYDITMWLTIAFGLIGILFGMVSAAMIISFVLLTIIP